MQDCDVRVLVTSAERLALLREELEECKSVEQVVLVGHDGCYGRRAWREIHSQPLAD